MAGFHDDQLRDDEGKWVRTMASPRHPRRTFKEFSRDYAKRKAVGAIDVAVVGAKFIAPRTKIGRKVTHLRTGIAHVDRALKGQF